MDINALKIAALVAQHGSFAAAARLLDLDPSSVSRSIATTEAALGFRLFQRSTRTLSITEEGQAFLGRITPMLDEFDHAKEAARQSQTSPTGRLKLTASVAFADTCIVPLLGKFHARYPDITVELLPTDANLDIAAEGIDLAIRLAPAPKGDVISTKLMPTRYLVCASPDYLRQHPDLTQPEDLGTHNCLRFALPAFRHRWKLRRAQGDLGDVGELDEIPISGNLVIGNALSLRRATLDGLGPALLADWLVAQDIEAGRLLPLFADHDWTATEFETAAWMLYPSRSYLPRKVRVMIDFLRAHLGA